MCGVWTTNFQVGPLSLNGWWSHRLIGIEVEQWYEQWNKMKKFDKFTLYRRIAVIEHYASLPLVSNKRKSAILLNAVTELKYILHSSILL